MIDGTKGNPLKSWIANKCYIHFGGNRSNFFLSVFWEGRIVYMQRQTEKHLLRRATVVAKVAFKVRPLLKTQEKDFHEISFKASTHCYFIMEYWWNWCHKLLQIIHMNKRVYTCKRQIYFLSTHFSAMISELNYTCIMQTSFNCQLGLSFIRKHAWLKSKQIPGQIKKMVDSELFSWALMPLGFLEGCENESWLSEFKINESFNEKIFFLQNNALGLRAPNCYYYSAEFSIIKISIFSMVKVFLWYWYYSLSIEYYDSLKEWLSNSYSSILS